MKKQKITKAIIKTVRCITNPRFLLCFGLGWIITNGWSYVLFAIGTYFKINWMIAVSSAYLAFLWLPISPEKLMTVTIAIFLLKRLFPNDQKTLAVLRQLHESVKSKAKEVKKKRKRDEINPV